jgi:hypothetical protein
MPAFEILQLVAASILMILGAIVFLVVFFRGMGWLDAWMKSRPATNEGARGRTVSLERPRRAKRRRSRKSSLNTVSSPARQRMAMLNAVQNNGSRAIQTEVAQANAAGNNCAEGSSSCLVKRYATVHLLSGEIIPRVQIASQETMDQAFQEMGIGQGQISDSMVFEDEDQRLLIVRSSNIKMLTWAREPGSSSTAVH